MEPYYLKRENGITLPGEFRQFLKKVEDGVCYRGDMHHEMPLSFREENIQLPNDRLQAVQCLHGIKKRLQVDPKYHADCTSFKSKIIDEGYTRKVNVEELAPQEGKVWYLPYLVMGVYHPRKPSSICVVFDCSAGYQGESRDDHLLQGPGLTSKLTAALTRFRKERVAFVAGIEKMFFLVKVTKNDQDCLCFLW